MIKIDDSIINNLLAEGRTSQRKRKNFNFHPDASDPMHRMLHSTNTDTYVQPHKHEDPDKTEAFIILKGKVLIVEFNEEGTIIDHLIMDPEAGNYGAEIPPRVWHTLITLEDDSLIYEVKNGPWDPADDKFFATWAPEEGSHDCMDYNREILSLLNLI